MKFYAKETICTSASHLIIDFYGELIRCNKVMHLNRMRLTKYLKKLKSRYYEIKVTEIKSCAFSPFDLTFKFDTGESYSIYLPRYMIQSIDPNLLPQNTLEKLKEEPSVCFYKNPKQKTFYLDLDGCIYGHHYHSTVKIYGFTESVIDVSNMGKYELSEFEFNLIDNGSIEESFFRITKKDTNDVLHTLKAHTMHFQHVLFQHLETIPDYYRTHFNKLKLHMITSKIK
jgi:hypothetical protein